MLGVGSSAADVVLHAAAVCSNSSLACSGKLVSYLQHCMAPLPPKLGAQERSQAVVAVLAMTFDYKLVNSNAIW